MLNDYPDVLTVEQVAKILGIGKNGAYQLLHDGVIGYKRIGARYLVPKVCVMDYLNSARYGVRRDNSRSLSERSTT